MIAVGDAIATDLAAAPRASESPGLTALAIVGRKLGINTSAAELARENQVVGDVDVKTIVRCALNLGLKAAVLDLTWDSVASLGRALPTILVTRNGGVLVLHAVEGEGEESRFLVEDPAEPTVRAEWDKARLAATWGGEAVLLKRDHAEDEDVAPFGVGVLAKLLFGERRAARDLAVCALVLSLLALTPMLFWRYAAGYALQYKAINTFWLVCGVAAILVAFEVVFSALRRHLVFGVTNRLDLQITTSMFEKVLRLPVDYFETTPVGVTLHDMGQISRIRSFMTGQLFGSVLDGLVLFVFMPIMFFFNPLLALIILVLSALIVLWVIAMLPAYARRSAAVQEAEAARGGFLSESIQGVRTVKSLSLEERQRNKFDVLSARIVEKRRAAGNLSNLIITVITPLQHMMVSGVFGLGVFLALRSPNPIYAGGELFTFLMLSQRLCAPLIQLSQLIQQYDEARAAVKVVATLVNQPLEAAQTRHGVKKPMSGHIEFSKVRFSYPGAIQPALRDLSFEVPTGTTLGVMGRSGSGKTTVTRLLQRLHSDYSGLIKIDGVDVREWDLAHLRSNMGVVLQENFLFSGTIRQNITVAKPDATLDEIVHAARLAGAEEFIDKLPQGYDTYIYEGSPNLSGGQRQRLAIARALITDPRLLILDEATSALDAESEAIVNANIERISAGRTVITISHRLSALVKADAIMVLDKGEIDDIGRHAELLERNDIYAALWRTQNQHAGPPAQTNLLSMTPRGPKHVA